MSDILSSEEVGALLSAFAQLGESSTNTPQAGSPRVKSYDFTQPVKMSHEGLKCLKQIHASFETTFSASLTEYLKVPVYSRYAGSSQMNYRDFWAAHADNAVLCDVSNKPVCTTMVVQASTSLVDACLEILMGGSGGSASPEVELTSMDCVMFAKALEVVLQAYAKSWARFLAVEPVLGSCQLANRFAHQINQNEPVLVFEYELRVASTVGTVSFCMPAESTSRMPDVPSVSERKLSVNDIALLGALGESVNETRVECRAVLGRSNVTIADIANLSLGDVLTLDTQASSDIEFWVGDKPAYAGSVGRKGSRVGIKVNRPL